MKIDEHGKEWIEQTEEERKLQRALRLARKTSIRPVSLQEMIERAPDDWQPGEFDLDEFLASIRGGAKRAPESPGSHSSSTGA